MTVSPPIENYKPSVGRIVHFYNNDPEVGPLAALIVKVHNDTCVNLAVFATDGTITGLTSITNNLNDSRHWTVPPRV